MNLLLFLCTLYATRCQIIVVFFVSLLHNQSLAGCADPTGSSFPWNNKAKVSLERLAAFVCLFVFVFCAHPSLFTPSLQPVEGAVGLHSDLVGNLDRPKIYCTNGAISHRRCGSLLMSRLSNRGL
jgi:hypothetical protein